MKFNYFSNHKNFLNYEICNKKKFKISDLKIKIFFLGESLKEIGYIFLV